MRDILVKILDAIIALQPEEEETPATESVSNNRVSVQEEETPVEVQEEQEETEVETTKRSVKK